MALKKYYSMRPIIPQATAGRDLSAASE